MLNILYSLLGVRIPALCIRKHKFNSDFSKVKQKNPSVSGGSGTRGRVEFWICISPLSLPVSGSICVSRKKKDKSGIVLEFIGSYRGHNATAPVSFCSLENHG